ncbi:hypothetical protein A3B84_02825 [Candidatus Nomurabacteria bacterium RIFCSPHIGHO2_02_FULL_35_13]|uniref:VanZ-like domain-containing protein n=1 Tax=Candidatus Nomurabacteria bacterium RIFCSPHIGHO2_02_FULL_35_13 TaxID=1801748 RepID=A0A1F6VN88_9BACT|nr:MAG: hypothetical protein A3B84_02825 [Candidatus Nomurabacteria bacterium RIFCSPHIGHO2_02_FULL_35_13]
MNPRKLLIRLVLFIFLIFLLNYLAMKFYWYSSIWYLDMPMHFLGGVWLGLAYIYVFLPTDDSLKSIFKIFFAVLFVGIGWEVFEILIDIFITGDSFIFLDTSSDIFFDFAGGAFAILYFIRNIMPIYQDKI